MLSYPIELTPDDNGTLLVTVPDIPEVTAVADSDNQVQEQVLDAIEAAFDGYFAEKRALPRPSKPKKGQQTVTLPALVAAKVLLAEEMLTQGVRKAELARRLDVNQVQVDRLLKFGHPSRIETIEAALGVLGKQLEVAVV